MWAGAVIHQSHQLHYHAGYVFCTVCARHAKETVKRLKDPCPGFPNVAGNFHLRKILNQPSTDVPAHLKKYLDTQPPLTFSQRQQQNHFKEDGEGSD